MALQLDYIIPNTTITVIDAYHRIEQAIQHNGTFVRIELVSYKNSTDRDNDKSIPNSRRTYTVTNDMPEYDTYFIDSSLKALNKSLYFNSYEYLKTLPEFSGATDV